MNATLIYLFYLTKFIYSKRNYKDKFMKKRIITVSIFIVISFIIIVPFVKGQDQACESAGYSIFYVNGILTNEDEAKKDKRNFEDILFNYYKDEKVYIKHLYNPSHFQGAGDLLQTASQLAGMPLNSYDLKKMLLDLHKNLTTKKLLLLGYSQGTLYANQIYEYLIQNGFPKESLAVYDIATPAHYIAGDGLYITSSNDKVINFVRKLATQLKINPPLPANIDIPLSPKEAKNLWGGHSLRNVYLANAASRIIIEIENALKKLFVSEDIQSSASGCFNPPSDNWLFKTEGFLINTGDFLTDIGATIFKTVYKGYINTVIVGFKVIDYSTALLADVIASGIKSGYHVFNEILKTIDNYIKKGYLSVRFIGDNNHIKTAFPTFQEYQSLNSSSNTLTKDNYNQSSFENISLISAFDVKLNPKHINQTPSTIFKDNVNNEENQKLIDIQKLSEDIYQATWNYYQAHLSGQYSTNSLNEIKQNLPSTFLLIPGGPSLNKTDDSVISTLSSSSSMLQNQNITNDNISIFQNFSNDNYSSRKENENLNDNEKEQDNSTNQPVFSKFQNQILINEIYIDFNNVQNQWLELKNLTEDEINLNGFSLKWEDYQLTFTEDDKIPPQGFYLLKYLNNEDLPQIEADKIFHFPFNLSGQKIALVDNFNLIIDEVDFSQGWLKKENDSTSRSIQRKDLSFWALYLNDGFNEDCLPKVQDKNGKVILGTPKKENDFTLTSQNDTNFQTIINQTTILRNQNYWCQRKSPYIIEFSEYSHPLLDAQASLNITSGTQIIFKYVSPSVSAPFNFNPRQRISAFEIQGVFKALGSASENIHISLDSDSLNNFNRDYLDFFLFKDTSQSFLEYLNVNIQFSKPLPSNIFNLQSSSFSLQNSLLKADTPNKWVYGISVLRPISPQIINNSFEGFYHPIFIHSQGELINGQNVYPAPIFKNNSGRNNQYNGITLFSGSGFATVIGQDWVMYENDSDFPYFIASDQWDYLTILQGATLKIMPGVKIMPLSCPRDFYLLKSFGTIDAQGTNEKPIIFTSSCQNPQPGDWQGISINAGKAIFKNVEFSFGGLNSNPFVYYPNQLNEMVLIKNSSEATLEDVLFKNSLGVGLKIINSNVALKNVSFESIAQSLMIKNPLTKKVSLEKIKIVNEGIKGSIGVDILSGDVSLKNSQIISGRYVGIHNRSPEIYNPPEKTLLHLEDVSIIGADKAILQEDYDDIIITIKNISLTNNTYNGIYFSQSIVDTSPIKEEVTLQNEVPYIIVNQALIGSGGKINIQEGTIFKIFWDFPWYIFKVKSGGTLEFNGTLDKPIYITDFHDDLIGGDTNNDGDASLPLPNNWKAIQYENGSSGVLKNVKIKYSAYPAIEIVEGANVTQENIIIDD